MTIHFAFSRRTEDSFPMCLQQDGNCGALVAYISIVHDFDEVYINHRRGDIIYGDVMGRRLGREGLEDILRKAGREMPWRVVIIVQVGAGFATCHNDARLGIRVK